MDKRPEADLEAYIGKELRQLPDVSVPPMLMGRVLSALAEEALSAARPWWKRPWWNWPLGAKAVSVLLFLASGLVVCLFPWTLGAVLDSFLTDLGRLAAPVRNVWGDFMTCLNVAGVICRGLAGNPWVILSATLAAATYLFFIGVGSFYVQLGFHHLPARRGHEH